MEQNTVPASNTAVTERLRGKAMAWRKTLPAGPMDQTAGENGWKWPQAR